VGVNVREALRKGSLCVTYQDDDLCIEASRGADLERSVEILGAPTRSLTATLRQA
jgi:hypothetical protein